MNDSLMKILGAGSVLKSRNPEAVTSVFVLLIWALLKFDLLLTEPHWSASPIFSCQTKNFLQYSPSHCKGKVQLDSFSVLGERRGFLFQVTVLISILQFYNLTNNNNNVKRCPARN